MSDQRYVATDASGVEHTPEGHVQWNVPAPDAESTTKGPGPYTLRTASGLLDVLDERIFRANAIGPTTAADNGAEAATEVRLTETAWSTDGAARFVIACARHILGDAATAEYVAGRTLASALDDATHALDEVDAGFEHLTHLAALSMERRLKRERAEMGALALGLVGEDGRDNVDVFDDPAYELLAPSIDAVLAAMEAVRDHVLPRAIAEFDENRERSEEHRDEDRTSVMGVPRLQATPFGPVEIGGGRQLPYETAWTGARETARHARWAQRVRGDAGAEARELVWQADALETFL